MPLFFSRNDISFFRHVNRELLNKWIQQEVAIYKLSLNETDKNLYGESDKKVYYRPVKVIGLVTRDPQEYKADELGQDYSNKITVAFLRDDLVAISLMPEVGDLILFDNEYAEIDAQIENKYMGGKNPDTYLSPEVQNWGWSVSIIYTAHLTSRTRINLTDVRPSINKDS